MLGVKGHPDHGVLGSRVLISTNTSISQFVMLRAFGTPTQLNESKQMASLDFQVLINQFRRQLFRKEVQRQYALMF